MNLTFNGDSGSLTEESEESIESPVLIIDDSNFNIESVKLMLKQMNITSNSAINGIEGLEKVRQRAKQTDSMYSLILLDYSMPLMDGPQAATKIREELKDAKTPKPFICCLSSYQDQSF